MLLSNLYLIRSLINLQMRSKHKSTVLEKPLPFSSLDIPTPVAEWSTSPKGTKNASMSHHPLPPPTCTEFVRSDEGEIVEIQCEGIVDAFTSYRSPPPPTSTEFVHSDKDEIIEIRCEGIADASTSHQLLPTGFVPGMYCDTCTISATPPEDVSVMHEEDAEVTRALEETGGDASSDESDWKRSAATLAQTNRTRRDWRRR